MSDENKNLDQEFLLKKYKPLPKKIAKLFILVWVIFIVLPVLYVSLFYASSLKEFAVIKGVSLINHTVTDQYYSLTNNLLEKIDINKYTSQIKVPTIRLDVDEQKVEKVQKISSGLAKLGLKQAQTVSNGVDELSEKINRINNELSQNITALQKGLAQDWEKTIKNEITSVADSQIQKQLGLGAISYSYFVDGDYGVFSKNARQKTNMIYSDLLKSPIDGIQKTLLGLDKYFYIFKWVVILLAVVLLVIPPFIVWKIAQKLSSTFCQCPYCHKIFLTKQARLNILKLFQK